MAQRKKKNTGKRVNRSPYDLLQSEYEKSQRRAIDDDGYMSAVVSQGPSAMPCSVDQGDSPSLSVSPSPAPLSASTPLVPLLLTMVQVCELLNVSRTTFYRMRKSGEIPGEIEIGGKILYHRETLEQWLSRLALPSDANMQHGLEQIL
ncbi:helix-turn-helix domain-containing protein [Citrifermentans bemidjiense]|uniref:helix-turn-helix domain-containing protein n=1 Tax=Citrifermentans bemidjiense TaxID=225194 RepID=UPI000673E265|nr:helix-turn-helix domain-containing protein [Citrifermentans bemidjiense]